MKNTTIYFTIAALAISIGIFYSCDSEMIITPEDEIVKKEDLEDAADDAFADDVFQDVDASIETELGDLEASDYQTWVDKSSEYLKAANIGDYTCKRVSIDVPDTSTFPKNITIDYGDSCSVVFGADTITKSGKVLIELTNKRFVTGSKRIVKFENYHINKVKVEGTKTITYNGIDKNEYYTFNIKLENGKLSFPDTTYYTRNSEHTRNWEKKSNPFNDQIHVTGITEGVNRRELPYSREIIEDVLIKRCSDYNYKWTIVDGLLECSVDTVMWTIDYGFGTCDNSAIITRNGQEKTINIRNRYRIFK